jgi:hypothetical protein
MRAVLPGDSPLRSFARPAALLLALAPVPARAACTPPVPPPATERPEKPPLPEKPACLSAKDGCPGFEAYTYGDAVKAYNAKLPAYKTVAQAYADKLKAYVDASVAYAKCEMKAMQ